MRALVLGTMILVACTSGYDGPCREDVCSETRSLLPLCTSADRCTLSSGSLFDGTMQPGERLTIRLVEGLVGPFVVTVPASSIELELLADGVRALQWSTRSLGTGEVEISFGSSVVHADQRIELAVLRAPGPVRPAIRASKQYTCIHCPG